MPRHIPEDLAKRYIALDSKIETLCAEQEDLKKKLRLYHAKGYVSDLIGFKDSSRQNIKWEQLVSELCHKYMKPGQIRIFYSKLLKRFPRKPIESSIVIFGKERKFHKKESASEAA